jgi:hypothetical protein
MKIKTNKRSNAKGIADAAPPQIRAITSSQKTEEQVNTFIFLEGCGLQKTMPDEVIRLTMRRKFMNPPPFLDCRFRYVDKRIQRSRRRILTYLVLYK